MKKPKELRTAFETFSIGEKLGEGGSGYVYRATDSVGRDFAIKILNPDRATSEKTRRFKNEYLFCSQEHHPNIIHVLDHGLAPDDVPFIVMPLYAYSLRKLMGSDKREQLLNLFFKMLDGVEAAHLRGVVHRDIKPENILLRDADQDLVVADFGIARFSSEELYTAVETGDATRLANFQYAAPEQRKKGLEVDERADIYALGLILNEMFTGQIVQGTNPKTIASVSTEASYLDQIVERMLAQDPTARFGSIEDLKKELKGRGEERIHLQRLSELKGTVISEDEIDDPLIADPPRIVGLSWNGGVLTIKLNLPVNEKWVALLKHRSGIRYFRRKGPESFRFEGAEASVDCSSDEAQLITDQFKEWLERMHDVYSHRVLEQRTEAKKIKEQQLRDRIAKEEKTLEVNRRLRF